MIKFNVSLPWVERQIEEIAAYLKKETKNRIRFVDGLRRGTYGPAKIRLWN